MHGRVGAQHFAEPLERRVMLAAVPVGPEFLVNTNTNDRQAAPSIAMDDDGDFVIAWHSLYSNDAATGVYAQRYNSAGIAQGQEFRVNTYTTGVQAWPTVAMDADGDFVIAWYSAQGSAYGIYAQRYNAAGVAQGDEFRVSFVALGGQTLPAAAMDADGNFVIAWHDAGQGGSGADIYARRYNADGIPQGDEFRINTYTTEAQWLSSVAMNANGQFIITWTSYGQDGSGYGVYARRYSAAGIAQGAEFQVNQHTVGEQIASAVAIDADGDFIVTWMSLDQVHEWDIYARRYNAAGIPRGGEFLVNTYTTGSQAFPAVATGAQGGFVISWTSDHQDGSLAGVFAQYYNAGGFPSGAELQVNTYTTGSQSDSRVAMDAGGKFVITWQSHGQTGAGHDIYAQRYAVADAPAVVHSSFRFSTAPHELSFAFSVNVSASLSADDLVLQNLTTGQTIPSGDFALHYDATSSVATFSYIGSAGGINGVLDDGHYRARLLATGITGPGGTPMAADHVFDFLFLLGDANNDGTVNLADFNILAANFGQSGAGIDFTKGDFNYDGTVNLADFNILAAKFGTILSGSVAGGYGGRTVDRLGESIGPFSDVETEVYRSGAKGHSR